MRRAPLKADALLRVQTRKKTREAQALGTSTSSVECGNKASVECGRMRSLHAVVFGPE